MTTRRKSPEKITLRERARRAAPKLLRLGLFLTALYAVGAVIVARRVRAEANEIMMGVGAQMMQYADADRQGEPRTLYLNGQRLAFGSGWARERSVDEVLDFFEARCRARDGRLADQLQELARARDIEAPDSTPFDGTLRDSSAHGGYVACFDVGEERQGVEGLLARLEGFANTGDLANLGGLRYVYAREMDEGGTHFVVFHTDDRLNVYEMFPRTGDAPGVDAEDVPRPANVRRLMSAWEEGDPHAMTMYTSTTRSSEELQAWYRQELPHAGWELVDPTEAQVDRLTRGWDEDDRRGAREARAIHAERGDRHVTIVLADDEPSHQGVVTVLTTR